MTRTIAAMIAVILLTSCGAVNRPVPDNSADTAQNGTNTSVMLPVGTPDQSLTPTPLPVPSPSPSPAAAAGEQESKTLYRMNPNYDIVPIEEGTDNKVVLLTFDDGPKDEKLLVQMLDTLDKHQAKAIFFVNGYRVKQNPELLKLIDSRGQTIGNHSWDHIDLKKQPRDKAEEQIKAVQQIVRELTGKAPQFFRPPFGSANDAVKDIAKNENMLFMTWSNGSEDWVAKYQTPEAVTQRVLEQLHPGSNILMHELQWTADALDGLLAKLKEHGYSFVDPQTISLE